MPSERYDADEHEAMLRQMAPIDIGHDHAIGWTPTGDIYWLVVLPDGSVIR